MEHKDREERTLSRTADINRAGREGARIGSCRAHGVTDRTATRERSWRHDAWAVRAEEDLEGRLSGWCGAGGGVAHDLVGGAQADRRTRAAFSASDSRPDDSRQTGRAGVARSAPDRAPDDRAGVIGAGGSPGYRRLRSARSTGEGVGSAAPGPSPRLGAGRLRRLERIRLGRCLDGGRLRPRHVPAGGGRDARGPASAARHAPVAGNGPALLPRLCDARTPG